MYQVGPAAQPSQHAARVGVIDGLAQDLAVNRDGAIGAEHRRVGAQREHGPWPCDNPWGDGQAGERIAQLLARLPLDRSVLEKTNSY